MNLNERIGDPAFRKAVELVDVGDANGLREHLKQYPQLPTQHVVFEDLNYFTRPTLLEFVAENPTRNEKLPPNIVEIATIIIDATQPHDQRALDETLALVCSGRVARDCGVQVPLIDLLCDRGAMRDGAMMPALAHGEFEAAAALIRHGATIDLAVAAAHGWTDRVRDLLATADAGLRHRALSLAAQHGQVDAVKLLLDAGEDPNRHNPPGFHAHSTPLHQAALNGHFEVARELIAHGARTDVKDQLFHGTAAEWAHYGGHHAIRDFLDQCASA
jgi:peptide-methionine (S)-S-oxide reductase